MKLIATRITAVFVLAAVPLFAVAHEGDALGKKTGKKAEPTEHAANLGEPGKVADATRTVEVRMTDAMRFEPSSIAATKGETIRFLVRNEGKLKHEMVLGTEKELKEHAALMQKFPNMQHADPNMVSLEPGTSGEMVWHFTKAGKFDFACLQPGHMEAGMKGKIDVAAK